MDNLIAEGDRVLDLAFVAAVWRYTKIVGKQLYRGGINLWPPTDEWSVGVATPLITRTPGAEPSATASVAKAPSQVQQPVPGADPSATASAAAVSSFTSVSSQQVTACELCSRSNENAVQ